MLHNPAYAGHAFYGKIELRPRHRITRRLRQRGLCSRDSSFRERPRQERVEIPVPALVSEATFALAQEQFEKNKRFSPRRTLEPSLLQGAVGLSALWLWTLPSFDANFQAHDLLEPISKISPHENEDTSKL
jgi:hypothetical protein